MTRNKVIQVYFQGCDSVRIDNEKNKKQAKIGLLVQKLVIYDCSIEKMSYSLKSRARIGGLQNRRLRVQVLVPLPEKS